MAGPQPPRKLGLRPGIPVNLQYLADLLEAERDRNLEFREEVLDRLGKMETRLAVIEAGAEADQKRLDRYKTAVWTLATTLVGCVITWLLTKFG